MRLKATYFFRPPLPPSPAFPAFPLFSSSNAAAAASFSDRNRFMFITQYDKREAQASKKLRQKNNRSQIVTFADLLGFFHILVKLLNMHIHLKQYII